MLKKKKKVSFPGCPFNKNKRPRLHSPKLNKDDTEEINVNKIPKTNEETPKLSQKTIDLLAEVAESAFDAEDSVPQPPYPPTNPPTNPPKSLFDQNAKYKDGVDCPNGETNGEANGEINGELNGEADEEMPPLVDETEV